MSAFWTPRRSRLAGLFVVALTTSAVALTPIFSADLRPDYRPAAYAIQGARIVVDNDTTIDVGTVVVRNGVIEQVGKTDRITVPYDAETIDGKGLVVYPGFINLYTTLGQASGVPRSKTGPGRSIPYGDFALPRTPPDNRNGMAPEFEVAGALELPESTAADLRKLGFTDLVAAPAGAIATGQSALVSLSGLPRREAVVHSPVGLHISLRAPFEPPPAPAPDEPPAVARRRFAGMTGPAYPMSLMGVVAHLRQAMLDARHDRDLRAYYAENKSDAPQLPFDPALKALATAQSGDLPVWWEANTRDEILRVLDLSEEFGTRAVIVGGREAGKVIDQLKAHKVPVVLRLDFPDEPKVPTESEYRKREAAERVEPLRVLADRAARWKERVETAKALAAAGVKFGLSTDGISKSENFPAQVRKAIDGGLSREAAVAALTQNAADIAGVGGRLGSIERGKLGHLVVLSGAFGDASARVRYVLADGLKFDLTSRSREKGSGKGKEKEKAESQSDEPKAPDASAKSKTAPARSTPAKTEEDHPAKTETPKSVPEPAKTQPDPKREAAAPAAKAEAKSESPAKAEQKTEAPAAPSGETKGESAKGKAQSKAETKAEPKSETAAPTQRNVQTGAAAAPPRNQEDQPPSTPFIDVAAEFDADRKPKIHTGGNVLIKDATILTVAPAGTIPKGSILVLGGKIKAVGADVTDQIPEGTKPTVIDATGLVAMPGIIDTHSHMAIQGGVNEMSLSIVPEVRVKDVVTGDDPTIFRALAGGTTTARLLHGSANTIGGQDAVIKLRYGQPGRDLILKDGDQGVKFALGENVTRRTGRFPNTRMGVEATIERAFEEARAYQAEWDAYHVAQEQHKAAPPPRRDLRLEALSGVLRHTIKIHSHCYRSDEILMLLRIASRYGVKVQSLQHVLEGYKVAAEIAAHGASASTFSDWWAYKVEAFDAIPYNAALLAEAGAQVCIKSDDEGLVRHLYLEAAKIMKYGGVSEAQALEMITLNPARQLGLAHRLGSIEVGKDADIALFNAHPFDGFARCELSLIDGEVWFQRREAGDKLAPRPGDHKTAPLASAEARARKLEIAANAKGLYALTGASLHPVSGPDVENGVLVIDHGKIAALGGPDTAIPDGAQTIDLKGLDVWPGMIDAGSLLGLYEIGSLAETQDYADSAPFQPELRTSVALHPDSELIPVTRANGVLSSFVQPTGGTIAGQGCAIDLNGWVPAEMLIADKAALVINIPRYVAPSADTPRFRRGRPEPGAEGQPSDPNQRRKDRLDAIKEQFKLALAYDKVVTEAKARKEPGPVPDPRLAALAPYARREKPVIFVADRAVEILDALNIASELHLKAVISGAHEAWKVADSLKKANVPVIVAGTLPVVSDPTDPYDALYANPAKLHEAGVTVAIRSGGRGPEQATASRNLPYEAAMAVAYGLPEAEALKAVTLTPARILRIDGQVGSLDPGKRANLVITAGHILQPTTDVKYLFIGGKPVAPESRHTRLFAKYRERLAEVKAGTAPLGLEPPAATVSAPASSEPSSPASQGAGERR